MLTRIVQEKYGNDVSTGSRRRAGPNDDDDHDDSTGTSTDSEEEDDEGILASEALDKQIQDTLEAIRRKDPRVYDEKARFFTDLDDEAQDDKGLETRKEKPMYLSDYHRRNLLEGAASIKIQDDGPMSHAQQQDDLKNVLVKEMHAAVNGKVNFGEDGVSDDSDDEFLVRKSPTPQKESRIIQSKVKTPKLDLEAADKDPETFLSNFMSVRAWVPAAGTGFQPFESDDEEEDRRAELFEEAYNLRFEDPQASNEKLLSHARDAAARYSVRKESTNPRKKAREAEQIKKEAARQAREEEKARYRKLKVSEVEEKIRRIKDAAGLRGKSLQKQDWSAFLDEGWDDERWEQEMQKRFGDDYYADYDSDDSNEMEGKSNRKNKKPKWKDDIDIDDLVPDFDVAEHGKPQFSLTDDGSAADGASIESNEGSDFELVVEPKSKPKSNKRRGRDEHTKEGRLERCKIEQLVDESMKVDETLSNFSKKHAGHFRYRETSPMAYGLTPHDILMASDSQLNQYAGLKKMAAFRDSDKKRKDKKRLGKKARLRQWRKETFGSEQGPRKTLAEVLAGHDLATHEPKLKGANGIDIRKKRTRSRKSKPSEHDDS